MRRGTDRPLFLRWALINALTLCLLVASSYLFFDDVHRLAPSSILFVIPVVLLVVFACMSSFAGWLMWQTDTAIETRNEATIVRVLHDSKHLNFTVSLSQLLGLVGTIAGFLIIFVDGFSGATAGTPQEVQRLMQTVAEGAATALLATLIGIVASIILGLLYHLLLDAIERYESGSQ